MNARTGNLPAAELDTGTGTPSSPASPDFSDDVEMSHKQYKAALHDLQVELVKLRRHFIAHGDRILALLEGRDSAGKDGSIKRIV